MKHIILILSILCLSTVSHSAEWSKTCTIWFNSVGANIEPSGITNYFEPANPSPMPVYKVFENAYTSSGDTGLPHHHYTFRATCEVGTTYVFTDNHVTTPGSPARTTSDHIFIQFINYGIPYAVWPGGHAEQVGFTAFVRNALNGQYVYANGYLWPGDTWAIWVVDFNWQRPDELAVRLVDCGSCTTYNCQPQNMYSYELFCGQ